MIDDEFLSMIKVENSFCPLHPESAQMACELETRMLNLPPPFQIVACEICGLRFLQPRPTKESYEAIYRESYHTLGTGSAGGPYRDQAQSKLRYFNSKLDYLERLLPSKGRMFEVGSSMGHFLATARARGWIVEGVDISEWAVKYAWEQFKVRTYCGDIMSLASVSEVYDLVVSFHTLEHLPNPLEALSLMNSLLKPGGILMVEVPNQFNDLFTKVTLPYQLHRAHGSKPTLVHTYFFRISDLRGLLQQSGFRPTQIRTWRKGYPINGMNQVTRWLKSAVNQFADFFHMGDIIEITAKKDIK
jgi:2-polyprenyl-3-methyl-5-hydroxy-6-metoxy-1,4-benzoquinol methylase